MNSHRFLAGFAIGQLLCYMFHLSCHAVASSRVQVELLNFAAITHHCIASLMGTFLYTYTRYLFVYVYVCTLELLRFKLAIIINAAGADILLELIKTIRTSALSSCFIFACLHCCSTSKIALNGPIRLHPLLDDLLLQFIEMVQF